MHTQTNSNNAAETFIYTAPGGGNTTFTGPDAHRNAMKAYAANGFSGTITPGRTVASGTVTGEAAQVSEIAKARIERHEQHLADNGIALPPPIYAAGTRVVEWGHENFAASRTAWEDQPETVQSLRGIWKAVKAEDRRDEVVNVRNIRMLDNGRIDFGKGDVGVEALGFKGLIARNSSVFPRGADLMMALDPDMRAAVWNRQIKKVDADKTLSLRIRKSGDKGYGVFAATSERYSAFDADQLAQAIGTAIRETGMRGEVIYNPATTDLRVNGLYHADSVVDLAAGDVFKFGVQFRSNDAAGGSIQGKATAWRNLCLNLIIIGTGSTELLRQRHTGNLDDLAAAVRMAAEQAVEIGAPFAKEWNILRSTSALDVLTGDARDEVNGASSRIVAEAVFGALTAHVDVGIKRDSLVELLLTSFDNEPGDSMADIVNAVTGVHLLDSVSVWQRERFEEAAGRLVPVLVGKAAEA